MRAHMPGGSLLIAVATVLPAGTLGAQWSVSMRAMQNPLPVGQCTAIEVVVSGPDGAAPLRPDGKQVSGWDFDLSFAAASPDAFAWKDERHRFLCARAPTAASARVLATYPGRHLQGAEVVQGVVTQQSVEVAMAGAPAAPTYASGGYPQAPPGPQGYAPPNGYPSPAYQPDQTAYGGSGGYAAPGAGPPQGGYPPQGPYPPQGSYPTQAATPPQGPYPPSGSYPSQGTYPNQGTDPTQGAYPAQSAYPAPQSYPQGPAPQAGPTVTTGPAPDTTPRVRNGKQFLQRITGHAKRAASDVASNTTTSVADATGDVIGNTLQTGGEVVKSGAGAVTGAAGKQVAGVGKVLGARQDSKDPEDIAAALAQGRVVLRGLRFTEGTAILEPSSGALISQIAGALARTPGQFLIEAHVDGKHSPAAQALSEQRAAAVKAALVAAGSSPMQLAAVGYGATRPIPGAKSNARVEIARTQ